MKKNLLIFLLYMQASMAGVAAVNDSNFEAEVLNSPVPVVVKCFTTWCSSCQDLAPVFTETSRMLSQYKFVELNTVPNAKTRKRYNIRLVPMILLFVNGEEVFRTTSILKRDRLVAVIKQYLQQ